MSRETTDLWARALRSPKTAALLVDVDPDTAASRTYYAAFYAVRAMFILRGWNSSRHQAVEVAVHRDLVKVGLWSVELGATYSSLLRLRLTGDYGDRTHVASSEARLAVEAAVSLLLAVHQLHPDEFPEFEGPRLPV